MERDELLKVVNMGLSLCLKLLIEHRILLLESCKLCLSLGLLYLSHRVPTVKLALEANRLRIPSKVPHWLWDVWITSRKHGKSVRFNYVKSTPQLLDASTIRAFS